MGSQFSTHILVYFIFSNGFGCPLISCCGRRVLSGDYVLGGSGDSGRIKAAVRPSPYLGQGTPIVLKPLKSHLIEFFFPLRCTSLETFASHSARPPRRLNFQTHKDLYENGGVSEPGARAPRGASETPAGLPRPLPTGQARGRPGPGPTPHPPPGPSGPCGPRAPGAWPSRRVSESGPGGRLQEAGRPEETLTPAAPPPSGPGLWLSTASPPSWQQTGRRARAARPRPADPDVWTAAPDRPATGQGQGGRSLLHLLLPGRPWPEPRSRQRRWLSPEGPLGVSAG